MNLKLKKVYSINQDRFISLFLKVSLYLSQIISGLSTGGQPEGQKNGN